MSNPIVPTSSRMRARTLALAAALVVACLVAVNGPDPDTTVPTVPTAAHPLQVTNLPAVNSGLVSFLTRSSNIKVSNEQPFPWNTEIDDVGDTWDPADPTVITAAATGWYWVGVNITTLGTSYGGPNNSNVMITVLKNWDGVSIQLGYYVAWERFANTASTSAQGNSLLQMVHLEAGDELQVALIGATSAGLLVESNPSDGLPSGFLTDAGPGTLSPHFYLIPV